MRGRSSTSLAVVRNARLGPIGALLLAALCASGESRAADAGATAAPVPSPAPTRAPAPPGPAPAVQPTPSSGSSSASPSTSSGSGSAVSGATSPSPAAPKAAAPAPAPKPAAAPAKPAVATKAATPAKKGQKPAPVKTSRVTRVPDSSARRQVAGGPTADDTVTGAESAELAALREAERELFPSTQATTDVFASPSFGKVRGASEMSTLGEAKPRVFATGLPPGPGTSSFPAAEGGKDLSWMAGLVMPELPVRWEPRLVRYLEFFKDDPRGKATLGLWLRRSNRYAESVRKVLRKKGVPEDLLWLSMIESGFEPTIRSPAGAIGLWQFMPETGRQYGLHQDRWLDQRMSVTSATEAAAEFLSDLHKRFGSWELAMAAYNMGYAGLLVVVRKYNTNDYWALSQLEGALPWETTLYVPKILAAAIVARNPSKFGFGDLALEAPLDADEIFVPPATPLGTIARAANVTPKEIETLNPELRAGRTPPLGDDDPKSTMFAVKVPAGKGQLAMANLPKVKRDEKPVERYVVRFGESLDQIALARGTTVGRLSELNAIAPGELVRGGTVLLVPREDDAKAAAGKVAAKDAKASPTPTATSDDGNNKPVVVVPPDLFVYPDKKRVFYRVTPGDSLRDVSAAFGVSVDDIRRWNALDPQGRLHEGMTLQLFVAPDADLSKVVSLSEADVRPLVVGSEEFFTHFEGLKGRRRIVLAAKVGDTLESIGKRYGLSVASMERINRRGRGETLKEGDRVVVYASTDPAKDASNAKSAPPVELERTSGIPGVTGPEPLGPLPPAPAQSRLP